MTILFFCKGAWPSDREKEMAEGYGITRFRNSKLADQLEKCDAVAGTIPDIYRTAGVEILEELSEEGPSTDAEELKQPAPVSNRAEKRQRNTPLKAG